MTPGPSVESASPSWDGGPAEISALICTYQRPHYLLGLLAALEAQDLPAERFEVVIVDDASGDGTWDELQRLAKETRLRLLVLRHEANRGPTEARNRAASRARSPILAFTDDDCLPSPRWLSAMLRRFDADVDVVQGRVEPDPADLVASGPWDHVIWVTKPSPFFETCNVAYRRAAFERVGGFDTSDPLLNPGGGRHFGEDADLAWRVVSSGGRSSFAEDALVHHRCVPGSFRRMLRAHRHATRFPGLARRSPLVARWLRAGVFLTPTSAAFDAAVVGGMLAVVTRRRWLALAALPWVRRRWLEAKYRSHGDRSRAAVLVAQHGVSDLVLLVSLVEGSVRYRRLML